MKESSMIRSLKKSSLYFAAFLALAAAQSPAFAANESVNGGATQSQAAGPGAVDHHSTGVYDRYDNYDNAQGFPQPGWSQLRGAS
jgi:hypothetical protein